MPEALSATAFRVFLLYWRAKLPGINCGPSCRRELCRGCRDVERRVYSALRPKRAAPFLWFASKRHELGTDDRGRALFEWRASYDCGPSCPGAECRGCVEVNRPHAPVWIKTLAEGRAWTLRCDRNEQKVARKRKGLSDLERTQLQQAKWLSLTAAAGLDGPAS